MYLIEYDIRKNTPYLNLFKAILIPLENEIITLINHSQHWTIHLFTILNYGTTLPRNTR